MWKETLALLRKDLKLEMRQRHSVAALFMFVGSAVFVCYLSIQEIENSRTYGALLWVVGLFGSFNAMARTFFSEGAGVHIYLYTLAHPRAVILAKIIYNCMLVMALHLLALALFGVFFGFESLANAHFGQLICGLLMGSAALAVSLTLMAGIAFKAGNNLGLLAILAFPVVVPVLVVLVRFSIGALDGVSWGENAANLAMLAVLALSSLAMALVLFPYLWRE